MTRLAPRACAALLALAALATPALAQQEQSTVYLSVISSGAFVVGAANSETGLFFRGTDTDTSWKHTGPMRIRANGFAVDTSSGGRTLYIAAGNGVHRSTDAGATWRVLTDWRITEVLGIAIDPHRRGRLFISSAYGAYVSTNGGDTWNPCNTGRTAPLFTQQIAVDPRVRDRVYCTGEDGLYRSDDGARTWKRCSLPARELRCVSISPVDSKTLLAGTENDGLYQSSDAGATWKRCATGGDSTFYAAVFDPSNSKALYAGGHQTGVYRSLDGGGTWTQSTRGFKSTSVHALAVDPLHPERVYAGTIWGGVYRSADAGLTWTYAGLSDSQVVCLSIVAPAGRTQP
jgi:photosystem II stability/assembly factor-like uncharacterized protein